jgi:CIC family chloride channel protein
LGGAVLAASIIYREDFEYRTLYPGFVTSATAYAVFGSFLGFDPMFGYVDAEYRFEEAAPLLWFVVLGVVAAAVGYLYARTFYGTVKLTARLPGGNVLWPTIGGLLVGLLALAVPQVLSSGYGWVQLATTKQGLLTIPL